MNNEVDTNEVEIFDPWTFDAENPEGDKIGENADNLDNPLDYDKLRFNESIKLRS